MVEPHASLLNKIKTFKLTGRALDIAMGKGRNSIFLAKAGFEVEGIEMSPEAIESAEASCKRENVTVKITRADLEAAILPRDAFNLVICFFYLQRDLIPGMKATLKKGGFLVYETFLIDQHLQFGSPRRKEFCLDHNELLNAFREFRIHYYEEGGGEGGKITARIIAEKQ